ncbi:hypothetical protein OCU04_002387 [Sclerotinia nivalis]|uniref:Uncharacterized protein n=1 Tax=Sclerotinia nivalis TaxID=352851 RepID=A0A9X0DQ45_9HELO|nr:hypothetical protein OCU04_002387 [Sclerotinia nivalis]
MISNQNTIPAAADLEFPRSTQPQPPADLSDLADLVQDQSSNVMAGRYKSPSPISDRELELVFDSEKLKLQDDGGEHSEGKAAAECTNIAGSGGVSIIEVSGTPIDTENGNSQSSSKLMGTVNSSGVSIIEVSGTLVGAENGDSQGSSKSTGIASSGGVPIMEDSSSLVVGENGEYLAASEPTMIATSSDGSNIHRETVIYCVQSLDNVDDANDAAAFRATMIATSSVLP